MKRYIICFAAICLCLCFLPLTAMAVSTADVKEPIDTSKGCSLTLNYENDMVAFSDLRVQVYHIANVSPELNYTLTGKFAPTELTLNGVTSTSEWDVIRTTLENYIAANELYADHEKHTDENGIAKFQGLTPGLYFVMPIHIADDGVYYHFGSSLTAIPGLDDNGMWIYDTTVKPKLKIKYTTGTDEQYSVVKLWRDNGNRDSRPSSVEVDIICNGETVKTVVLSDENNWSYSWSAPDNGDVWKVSEKNVPKGYVMTIDERTTSFTIVNTFPSIPEVPKTGDTLNIGMFVTLVCAFGLILVVLGIVAKRKTE